MGTRYGVDVYFHGNFIMAIRFRKKWQAYLFHILLNRSVHHQGVRDY